MVQSIHMDGSDERVSSARTTRKRATRTSSAAAGRRRASRRSPAEPRISEKRAVEAPLPKKTLSPDSSSRKAPTSFATKKASKKSQQKRKIIVMVVLLTGICSSAAVGIIDGGQIDVNETIEQRNERIRSNQANENDTLGSDVVVPVQNTPNAGKPDGGLKGLGIGSPKPKSVTEIESASSTASSTEGVASSTEAVASSTDEVVTEAEENTEEESSGTEGDEVAEPAI